jgi:hypothetical protein
LERRQLNEVLSERAPRLSILPSLVHVRVDAGNLVINVRACVFWVRYQIIHAHSKTICEWGNVRHHEAYGLAIAYGIEHGRRAKHEVDAL